LVFLHKSGKAVEIVGPEAGVAIEPVHRLLHRLGSQPARNRAAGLLAGDQAGIRQHVEMLHDRGQRHRKWPREFAYGHAVLFAKPCQQRATRGIGKRSKGAVQRFAAILNHMV
jgi:hypothetical protein